MVAGALLLAALAPARTGGAAEIAGDAVFDEGHLLASGQRRSLEGLLLAKGQESGTLLSVRLVPNLTGHQSVNELARRTFVSEGLAAAGPPRVLLVVALRERAVAIETGQGPAGIVPEIDARRIVRRLESGLDRRRLPTALDEAVGAIAASARATAERRRPLPPDPLEGAPLPARVAPSGMTQPDPEAEGAGTKSAPLAAPAPGPSSPGGRSLVPTAALVSAAVVLGLALRRRRRFADERVARTTVSPSDRKGSAPVKSVGDRRMS